MRLSVRSLRRVVKGDLPIEFVQQDLTSYVRRRRSRVGYNPKTRTRVDIPAKRVLHFQAGREMRRLLAGGPTAAD